MDSTKNRFWSVLWADRRVTKKLFDFAWAYSSPFVTEMVLHKLERAGVRNLTAVPASIKCKTYQQPKSPYLELQIEHQMSLADALHTPCGESWRHGTRETGGRKNG